MRKNTQTETNESSPERNLQISTRAHIYLDNSHTIPTNMQELIDQMQQIEKQACCQFMLETRLDYIDITCAIFQFMFETKQDYIDVMCAIYRHTKIYNHKNYRVLFPVFIATLKNLLKQVKITDNHILRLIGLNDWDIALLNHDIDAIKQIIEKDETYIKTHDDTFFCSQLVQHYRMLEIAEDMHTQRGLLKYWQMFSQAIRIGHQKHELRIQLPDGKKKSIIEITRNPFCLSNNKKEGSF